MKPINSKELLLGRTGSFPANMAEKIFPLFKDALAVLSFSFLTAVSAQMKTDVGPVPITGQTLVVLLSGAFLGARKGALSQMFYLAAGISGLGWFSRGGGPAYILSPTFGYLAGFIFAAYAVGFLAEKGWMKTPRKMLFSLILGNASLYASGLLWLLPFTGWHEVLAAGLYPFIAGDALKIAAAFLLLSLKKSFRKPGF